MKQLVITLVLLANAIIACAQGSGFGYHLDVGGSSYQQPGEAYSQSIYTITHNGFIRFHNKSGKKSFEIMVGYRMDTIPFQNHSDFLAPDGATMMQYNTDAYLKRDALKVSLINHRQFGIPGRFLFALNSGLFYEYTLSAARYGYNDLITYNLYNEMNEHNVGFLLGAEIRFVWFTIGYKYEKLFLDMLDHDYILSQELNVSNSTEMRGLVLNPGMHYLTLGINFDFFDKD
jgi:hypothetical protein